MRTMFDSDVAADIPTTASMVAGYVDHSNPWTPADWARFPGAVKVRIARGATTDDGHVGDCEAGLMTPQDLVAWVRLRRASGADPTGYCAQSQWQTCRAAFTSAGVPEPHWWVAAYPGGGPVIPAGAVAHQYADPNTSGGHYDLSAVLDYWPGVDDQGEDMTPEQDTILRDIREQLCGQGCRAPGQYTGWQSQVPGSTWRGTVVDFVRSVDARTFVDATTTQPAEQQAIAALAAEEAALLAAVKAVPVAQVDAAAVAAALDAAGLPQQLVAAFVAVLNKAVAA